MMHPDRPHSLVSCESFEDMAREIKRASWTLCTGWTCGTLTLLHDGFDEDSIVEWAVIRHGRQIESITTAWLERDALAAMLVVLDRDGSVVDMGAVAIHTHPLGTCELCA